MNKQKSDFKILRYRSWECPHCRKTVIAAEVDFTTAANKRYNTLRILSEAEMIKHQEKYINYLEDKLLEKMGNEIFKNYTKDME